MSDYSGVLIVRQAGDRAGAYAFDSRIGRLVWNMSDTRGCGLYVVRGHGFESFLQGGVKQVLAIDPLFGTQLWVFRSQYLLDSVVEISDSRVAIEDVNGRVSVVCTATGALVWTIDALDDFYQSLIPRGDNVWYLSSDGSLRARSMEDGKEIWNLPAGTCGKGWAGGRSQHLYTFEDGQKLFCIDSERARVLWSYAQPKSGTYDSASATELGALVIFRLVDFDEFDDCLFGVDLLSGEPRLVLPVCGYPRVLPDGRVLVHDHERGEIRLVEIPEVAGR